MGRLTVLEQIAQDIAAEFGTDCEVVIHDLKTKEPEHSIIYIVNGHVTGRNVGDGPSDAVFDGIRQKGRGSDYGSSRPQWLPDENSRRQDFEVQYFIYKGR